MNKTLLFIIMTVLALIFLFVNPSYLAGYAIVLIFLFSFGFFEWLLEKEEKSKQCSCESKNKGDV